MLKNGLIEPLTKLFNLAIEQGTSPKQWYISEIVLLHKKGDRHKLDNYRPISLSSNMNKIFMKILQERIYKTLDLHQPNEQAGFRKNFSVINHLQTLNQVFEKTKEYDINICLAFVDFTKAFDSLYHDRIWESLNHQNIPANIIRVIKDLYSKSKAYIKMDKRGNIFSISRGVRQGDPLSPNIFNCVLQEIFRKFNWKEKGIKINGEWLNNLRFADDIVLIGKNIEEIELMLKDLDKVAKEYGLNMNELKTKIMANYNTKKFEIKISNMEIEKVEEIKYLGQIFSFNKKFEKEIGNRLASGWKAFWALKNILQSKIKIENKIRILEMCVLPCITYGAQTWAITQKQTRKLTTTQLKMLRNLLKIKRTDRIENTVIRAKTKMKDIASVTRLLKLKYAGHMMRENWEKWDKKVSVWVPYDKIRKKGRPAMRWRDEIRRELGLNWENMTTDRNNWRQVVEAYARRANW